MKIDVIKSQLVFFIKQKLNHILGGHDDYGNLNNTAEKKLEVKADCTYDGDIPITDNHNQHAVWEQCVIILVNSAYIGRYC